MGNKHDSFFKQVFKDEKNVLDFLTDFMPRSLSGELDLSHIEVADPASASEEEREYISDVVIKTRIRERNHADIYLLFEHKSYKDKKIHLQLLRYMYEVWNNDYNRKAPFRIVIPIVFYQVKFRGHDMVLIGRC